MRVEFSGDNQRTIRSVKGGLIMSLSTIIPYLYVFGAFVIFGACALEGLFERWAKLKGLMDD